MFCRARAESAGGFLIFCLLLATFKAHGMELLIPESTSKTDSPIKRGLTQVGREITSPLTTEALPYFLIGSGASLYARSNTKLRDDNQQEFREDRPLKGTENAAALYGELWPNLAYTAIQSANWYFTDSQSSRRRAVLMAKTTAYSGGMAQVMKLVFHDSRPDHHGHDSFPSGHTTTAFAFAGVIIYEHGWAWGLPALVAAGLTGVERMNDNHHYLQDVLAGATLGFSYAAGLYFQSVQERIGWAVYPVATPEGAGLALSKKF